MNNANQTVEKFAKLLGNAVEVIAAFLILKKMLGKPQNQSNNGKWFTTRNENTP